MSTRCNIQVQNSDGTIYECMVYRHSDGYPESVLPFLEPFVNTFKTERGCDPEYFVAQFLRHAMIDECKEADKDDFYKKFPDAHPSKSYLGWGVCTELHGDIEYLYTVDLVKGKVKVKKV